MGFFRFCGYFALFSSILIGLAFYVINLPGKNGFGRLTPGEDVVPSDLDLTNKNVIVTGGYSGIGIDTVRVLASHNASVWVPTRDMKKCEQAIKKIKEITKKDKIYCMKCDLSSLQSVRDFATEWKKLNLPLNILINNAGIMAIPFSESVDGYELQFATNHLGHFLLTNLLMENLKQGKQSRVINVSSGANFISGIRFDDLKGKDTWYGKGLLESYTGPWVAYGQSKTANILFSVELNKKMKGFGNAYSCHPGGIRTGLQDGLFIGDLMEYDPGFMKTPSQGAATQLYLATAYNLESEGGKFYDDCNPGTAASHSLDENVASRLWELSEELTGLKKK